MGLKLLVRRRASSWTTPPPKMGYKSGGLGWEGEFRIQSLQRGTEGQNIFPFSPEEPFGGHWKSAEHQQPSFFKGGQQQLSQPNPCQSRPSLPSLPPFSVSVQRRRLYKQGRMLPPGVPGGLQPSRRPPGLRGLPPLLLQRALPQLLPGPHLRVRAVALRDGGALRQPAQDLRKPPGLLQVCHPPEAVPGRVSPGLPEEREQVRSRPGASFPPLAWLFCRPRLLTCL